MDQLRHPRPRSQERRQQRLIPEHNERVGVRGRSLYGNGSGWGSNSAGDWHTVFQGELDVYDPEEFHTANSVIPFDGALARYVVITSSAEAQTMNWVAEKWPELYPNLDAGLSEVRFHPVSEELLRSLRVYVVRGPTGYNLRAVKLSAPLYITGRKYK